MIKITEQNGKTVISAQELYDFLEIKTQFRDWFPRMVAYGFEDGLDFSSILSESTGWRPSVDYAITIDMAKELSMLQRTEKGKQARYYFIECERKLKEVVSSPKLPQNYIAALEALIGSEKKKEQLSLKVVAQQNQLQESAPKMQYHDKVLSSKSTYTTTQIGKDLGLSGMRLNSLL